MATLTCFFLFLIIPYAASITFDFPNITFQNSQGEFKLEMGAYVSNRGIEVTPETRSSEDRGRATYHNSLRLWDKSSGELASFDTEFSFIIDTLKNLAYADGLTFFLAENNTLITTDGAIGLPVDPSTYKMTYPFVAVEFDTYESNRWDPIDLPQTMPGVGPKHVGIDVNSLKSVECQRWTNNVLEGEEARAHIRYDSNSHNFSVLVYNSTDDIVVQLNHLVDLRDVLPEWVIFGFSASTEGPSKINGLFQKNMVKSWKFNSSNLPGDKDGVEPPTTSPNNCPSTTISKIGLMVGIIAGVVVVTFLGIIALFLSLRKNKKQEQVQKPSEGSMEMTKDFELGTGARKFYYEELVTATDGFDEERNKLGEGGFGGVYKGFLKDVDAYIAVKRVSKTSEQGIKEYASEVKIISRLRHRNLVQLNGWCHEKGELLLVYEFLENGSLDLHLFKEKSLLSWGTRYKIAHGLASALLYLHYEWEHCVLHRDIKSSNVMLDSNFNAKLGDFGLAKLVDHEKDPQTTNKLAGTVGYMAPEYIMTGKASKEADVFSFGVVALEIACGRKPLYCDGSETKTELVEWVWDLYGNETLHEAVDRRLGSDFVEEEIKRLMVVGLWCTHPDPIARPSMRQVIQVLMFEASLPELPLKMPKPTYYAPFISTSNRNTSSDCNTVSSDLTTF